MQSDYTAIAKIFIWGQKVSCPILLQLLACQTFQAVWGRVFVCVCPPLPWSFACKSFLDQEYML